MRPKNSRLNLEFSKPLRRHLTPRIWSAHSREIGSNVVQQGGQSTKTQTTLRFCALSGSEPCPESVEGQARRGQEHLVFCEFPMQNT